MAQPLAEHRPGRPGDSPIRDPGIPKQPVDLPFDRRLDLAAEEMPDPFHAGPMEFAVGGQEQKIVSPSAGKRQESSLAGPWQPEQGGGRSPQQMLRFRIGGLGRLRLDAKPRGRILDPSPRSGAIAGDPHRRNRDLDIEREELRPAR
jgi:hypothetical protein